jgi:hypothetical protein
MIYGTKGIFEWEIQDILVIQSGQIIKRGPFGVFCLIDFD